MWYVLLSALFFAPSDPVLQPGLIQYTEGSTFASSNAGETAGRPHLVPDSVLVTRNDGRAEVLLTPGVVLWVGPNSRLRLLSAASNRCDLELAAGEALLQVLANPAMGTVTVKTSGNVQRFTKAGLFRLSAAEPRPAAARKDDLWRWARERDTVLARANLDAAKSIRDHHEIIESPIWAWDGPMKVFTYLPLRSQQTSPFEAVYWSPEYVHNAFRPSMAGAGGGILSTMGAPASTAGGSGVTDPKPKPSPAPVKQ
jgi:hypothetical protein